MHKELCPIAAFTFTGLPQVARYPKALQRYEICVKQPKN